MNKTEFVNAIASSLNSTKADAARFLNAYIAVVKDTLQNGEEIRIIGFGSFKVKEVQAKEVRNPQTGDKIKVPATKRPKFMPGKEFKEAVNGRK